MIHTLKDALAIAFVVVVMGLAFLPAVLLAFVRVVDRLATILFEEFNDVVRGA
jgi:hypothetical protein